MSRKRSLMGDRAVNRYVAEQRALVCVLDPEEWNRMIDRSLEQLLRETVEDLSEYRRVVIEFPDDS